MRQKSSAPPARNYDVGKGRPPQATRWKPGESGNPKGRPKGAKSAAAMADAALKRKITVTVNGTRRRMTVAEVSYRQLADKAMAGDQKALAFLLTRGNELDRSNTDATDSVISAEQDLAIIADYYNRRQPKKGRPR